MTKRKPKPNGTALEIISREALSYIEGCYKEYGTYTLEDRALPDLRDGLLKVHRRSLWSMYNIAPSHRPHIKTARVSGDVIGKYHPHGDAAVNKAIETMVNMPTPLADGLGNWGGQTDSAAAARYTNVRLSEFSTNVMVNKDYMPTCQLIPNYDNKDVEPVLLPALLPNVLLNGVSGISMGLSCNIPSFEPEGVIKVLKGMLKGKKATTSVLKKLLVPTFAYGGYCSLQDEWQPEVDSLLNKGKGSLIVYCDWDLETKGELNITAVPPRLPPETVINRLIDSGMFTSVADVMGKDTETPAHIRATLKRGVKPSDVDDWCNENLFSKVHYQIAVVERYYSEEEGKVRATIHQLGVGELLSRWLDWRKEIEAKMLENRVSDINERIKRKNLLLLAQENRKTVAASWEKADAVKYLCGELDIDEEDSRYILNLRIGQLSKLDREQLQKELDDLNKEMKATKRKQKDISQSVLDSLDNL